MYLYYLGIISMLVVGISLGLLGGGGAVLAVPIMAYMMGLEKLEATSYSLFVVGATGLVGAIRYLYQNPSEKKTILQTATQFSPVSILVGLLTRKTLQYIPNEFVLWEGLVLWKSQLLMLSFAVIMLLVAYPMIRKPRTLSVLNPVISENIRFVILKQGIKVGVLSGLAGAGGGFLITPTLHRSLGMPMKQAIGTSLWIIAANAWIIFLGDRLGGNALPIQWAVLLPLTAIAVVGVFLGNALSRHIPNQKLKIGFGYFVLFMGVVIVLLETRIFSH